MMIMNYTEVSAKMVMTINPARIIGKIRYPIVNIACHEVAGFVVDDEKWLTETRVLLFPLVRSMDKDTLTVEDSSSIMSISNLKSLRSQLEENIQPVGHKVVTETGMVLGFIEDYSFNPANGKIDAYKIKNSNTYIHSRDVMSSAKFLMVVRENFPVAEDVRPVVHEPVHVSTGDSYNLNSLFERRQIEFALGKRLLRNVSTEDGHVIASEGDVIDEQTICRAKNQGRFTELVMSIDSFDMGQ